MAGVHNVVSGFQRIAVVVYTCVPAVDSKLLGRGLKVFDCMQHWPFTIRSFVLWCSHCFSGFIRTMFHRVCFHCTTLLQIPAPVCLKGLSMGLAYGTLQSVCTPQSNAFLQKDASNHIPSRLRCAQWMLSSTLRTITLSSVADIMITTCFTLSLSSTLRSCTRPAPPPNITSTPSLLLSSCAPAARNCVMTSAAPMPALSQMMVGIFRSARPKASMASDALPACRLDLTVHSSPHAFAACLFSFLSHEGCALQPLLHLCPSTKRRQPDYSRNKHQTGPQHMTCRAKEALTCHFHCHFVNSSCRGYLRVADPINHTPVCNCLTQHTRRASCMLHSASSSRC
jgi:hypothetical protein